MKKFVFLFAASAFLLSCNNSSKQEPTTVEIVDTTIVTDTHNSKNSLDYQGVYKGTYKGQLPGANSEMDVTIVLSDSTYTKDIVYKDKNSKPFSSKGSYTWNEDGSIITLTGEEKPNQYKVGENTLTQLDIEGKPITGELASMYVLKK